MLKKFKIFRRIPIMVLEKIKIRLRLLLAPAAKQFGLN